jgi:hypothetical protein
MYAAMLEQLQVGGPIELEAPQHGKLVLRAAGRLLLICGFTGTSRH